MKRIRFTLKTVRIKSKEIHNDNFIIHSLEMKQTGNSGRRSFIDIECRICSHRKWTQTNDHINGKHSCRVCSNGTWTLKRARKELEIMFDKDYIIHNISLREVGNTQKQKISFIDIECTSCKTRKWKNLSAILMKKTKCVYCNMWTLEKAQKLSKNLYNDKFIIRKLSRKNLKREPYINIECIDCGYINWVSVKNHKECGCGGKCNIRGQRNVQLETLRNNPILANQPYKLYFLKFTHKVTNEQFYKVGKTKFNIQRRFRKNQYNDYIIEECQLVEGTHLWVAEQEEEFIEKYKDYQYTPNNKFDGWTECFKPEIIKEF